MAAGENSFIDIVVLDAIRERFARGEPMVVLSTSLEEVLWANGPGAALFGFSDIETIMGAESGLGIAARRQIAATPGYPKVGSGRPIMVRLAGGLSTRAAPLVVSELALPDGTDAILLRQDLTPAQMDRSVQETAARAISGIENAGQHAGIVDADGRVVTGSAGFAGLGIPEGGLATLAGLAAPGKGRVLKRMLESARGPLPSGFVRIADSPPTYLALVVEIQEAAENGAAPAAAQQSPPETGVARALAERAPHVAEPPAGTEPASAPAVPEQAVKTVEPSPARFTFDMHRDAPEAPAEADEAAGAAAEAIAGREPAEVPASGEPAAGAPEPELSTDAEAADHDEADAEQDIAAPPAAESIPAQVPTGMEPASASAAGFPVRFVWRTDADGRFVSISPEFVEAVGQDEATIVGQHFSDVAEALGFDEAGEIAALLARRDTWSGRTVFWPVDGTIMRAPVDLAALPVYGRERNFEGFRGFGVARLGDAIADTRRRAARPAAAAEPAHEAPTIDGETAGAAELEPRPDISGPDGDAAAGDDPFRGEAPALSVTETPERRASDKVVRIAEFRPIASEQPLSAGEENAFREIGDRLRTAAQAPEEQEADAAPREDAASAPTAGLPQPTETAGEPGPVEDEAGPAERPAVHADAAMPVDGERTEEEPARQAPGRETGEEPAAAAGDAPIPSAFAVAGRQDETETAPPAADTSIIAQLPTPLLILAGETLHFANRAFFELSGYGSLEALRAAGGLGELFADPIAEGGEEADGRALILQTADADMIPVEAHLRTVPWQGGTALMLALRDLSEDETARALAVRAAPSRRELEARVAEMRTILDTATDGVVLIAPDETIRSVNRPAEALFGFERDELAGKPFVSLFAMESQRAARDYLAGLADNGVASVLNDGREVIGREVQGRFIPLFMTIGKLPGDSGYCAVMRDITHWKRAEEDLTQARAMAERASSQKTEFLARISHEIRTPLNAIIGFSELMMDEKFGPIGSDRYRDYLRDINRSGNLVLDLVNDLLDISKIEAGEQEMNYEAVALNDALGETVAMMQPQANRERVIIRSSFASKLPEIVADLRSIRQIALNLLSNAVRYTQAGGQVIVSTALEPTGEVVMRVRDTGIGMSRSEIEQALKPFKQINALKRGRSDGTGLGLPLTKAMVEANRARFQITSAPGEGTLVEVIFPSTRVLAE